MLAVLRQSTSGLMEILHTYMAVSVSFKAVHQGMSVGRQAVPNGDVKRQLGKQARYHAGIMTVLSRPWCYQTSLCGGCRCHLPPEVQAPSPRGG